MAGDLCPLPERLPVKIEDGITLDELIRRIQAARGKPMRVVELPELALEEGALCGLWLATDTEDIVLHAPSDSPLHREQFILHELAHMILQHDRGSKVFTPRNLLPNIGPDAVLKALARDSLNDEYELSAESLADDLAAAIRKPGSSRFLEVFG